MTSIEKFELVEEKYERLMKLHGDRLKAHSKRLTRNTTDAEDLYQDTALKIYMNMEKMTDENKFVSWSMRVMQNIFLDKKRYDSRRPQTTSFDELTAHFGCEIDFVDPKVDVESEVMLEMVQSMPARQLRGMIASLSPVYSNAVSLNTYGTDSSLDLMNSSEGLNYKSIAERTKTEVGTVRSRLFRAREMLKKMAADKSIQE